MPDILVFAFAVSLLAACIWLYVDQYGWKLPPFWDTGPSRSRPQTPHISQPRQATPQSASQNAKTSSQALALVPRATQSVVSVTPQMQRLPAVVELTQLRRETWRSGLFEGTFSRHKREGYERRAYMENLLLAEEAQRVRHSMEVREIAHVGKLAAARDAVIADAAYRREQAAHLARTTSEALDDHARTRAQKIEDAERTRNEQLADHDCARWQRYEDYQLTRPRVIAEQRFQAEVEERKQNERRAAWQDADADRAQQQAQATDDSSRSRPEDIASQQFAIEQAERTRERTRKAWKEEDNAPRLQRDEAEQQKRERARDEDRARRLAKTKAAAKKRAEDRARRQKQVQARKAARDDAARRAREARDAAKQARITKQDREKAARAQTREEVRAARAEAREREAESDQAILRARERELAALNHDLAVQELQALLHQVEEVPSPPDPAEETLRRECERIALEVSTGVALVNDQNLYHGFAAIKFREFAQTATSDEAQRCTADVLFARRWQQPEMTRAQADAFAAEYARILEAAADREGMAMAKSVIATVMQQTKDKYAPR
jgi:hypothetical protein